MNAEKTRRERRQSHDNDEIDNDNIANTNNNNNNNNCYDDGGYGMGNGVGDDEHGDWERTNKMMSRPEKRKGADNKSVGERNKRTETEKDFGGERHTTVATTAGTQLATDDSASGGVNTSSSSSSSNNNNNNNNNNTAAGGGAAAGDDKACSTHDGSGLFRIDWPLFGKRDSFGPKFTFLQSLLQTRTVTVKGSRLAP